jgi:hypothetical protein
VNRNLASAQDNPYKFERPLSVSDYYSHRSNDELDYHEDQMAVETHQIDDLKERIDMVDMIAMDDTKLRKRRIEVRPRPRVQRGPKPKINKDFPQFPNFPQVYENSNNNLRLNTTNKNITETLPPIAQPLTMSKAASTRLRNHNSVRRKIDTLPINLTPGSKKKESKLKITKVLPPLYDYYDDYYDYNWRERDNPCHNSYYGDRRKVSRNVLASDLGIIAKGGSSGEMKFAVTDLMTTQPLNGVEIEVYNYQQQLMSTATTDAEGFASISLEAKPYLLIAKKDAQRGYLRLDDGSSLSLSKFDVGGKRIQKGIKGFIYGEHHK